MRRFSTLIIFSIFFLTIMVSISFAQSSIKNPNVQPSSRLKINLPDLVVSITSIGTPHAENRDPSTGRLDSDPSKPIYLTIPFSITIRNNGTAPARPLIADIEWSPLPVRYNFHFKVPGSRLEGCPFFDEPLAPGGSKMLSGTIIGDIRILSEYRALEGATVRFRAKVDPGLPGHPKVTESNEGNNYSGWSSPVTLPRAILSAEGFVPPPPDLRVRIDEMSVREYEYDSSRYIVKLGFTITNIGGSRSPATGDCWEIFYFSPSESIWKPAISLLTPEGRGDCPTLARGESRSVINVDRLIPRNATKIRIKVDVGNRIVESDETNNYDERNIIILAPPMKEMTR